MIITIKRFAKTGLFTDILGMDMVIDFTVSDLDAEPLPTDLGLTKAKTV